MSAGSGSERRSQHALRLRSYALEREIERLVNEERNELAVLLCQTLLELRVEAELWEYFRILGEEIYGEAALGLLPSFNINDGRVRKFFERLVGAQMRDENMEAMEALREHVERRNRIAHRGEEVDGEAARASLRAVRTVSQLVHALSYRAMGLDDELEEEARARGEPTEDDDE